LTRAVVGDNTENRRLPLRQFPTTGIWQRIDPSSPSPRVARKHFGQAATCSPSWVFESASPAGALVVQPSLSTFVLCELKAGAMLVPFPADLERLIADQLAPTFSERSHDL